MYKGKQTAEESLKQIMLRMNYDISKSLKQNLQEQELSEIGVGLAGMAQTSNNSTTQSTTTNTTQQGLPSDIGGVEGVKKFQDWLDKTKGEWAFSKKYNKNYKVNQNPKLGYGVYGPNTNKMWNDQTIKDEYIKEMGGDSQPVDDQSMGAVSAMGTSAANAVADMYTGKLNNL